MDDMQKYQAMCDGLLQLEAEYRREDKPSLAQRVRDVRLELEPQLDIAARLYDILTTK